MVSPQQKPQRKHTVAFILGNGVSRLSANLPCLSQYGTIYGCNALYREFEPDHLIAVDVKMINEIIDSDYHKTHSVWTNKNRGVKTFDNINVLTPHKGWSSGPTALWLSTTHEYKEIYILGFDYQGINGKVNNVYAGTPNYKKEGLPATFFGNWSSQTERVIKENSSIQFYRVQGDNQFVPPNLRENVSNFSHIDYSILENKFPGSTYILKKDQKSTI
jgi:hypothetical protein